MSAGAINAAHLGAHHGSFRQAIEELTRPVDTIKHQAKTVTVGTSRLQEKVEGLLFETLAAYGLKLGQTRRGRPKKAKADLVNV